MIIDNKKIENSIENLLKGLPRRSREVLIKRFGLKKGEYRSTLESIGQGYSITRERIRQIENSAKNLILETESLLTHTKEIVTSLKKTIESFGGIVGEQRLLNHFTDDKDIQDHLHFILQLAPSFFDIKKPDLHDKLWYTEKDSYKAFEKSIEKLYKDLSSDDLLTEKEIVDRFTKKLLIHTDNKKLLKNDTVRSLIEISKKIDSNGLNQWGRADSRNISAKGMRDFSFLILNEVGNPMHFKKITEEISERFKKKVNVATVHNELIKDKRFILVGRGLYGLKSWDKYSGGTVKEVIIDILKKSKKALSKNEIMKIVLEKKDVRKQTVIINLSNKAFKRTKDGKYKLA